MDKESHVIPKVTFYPPLNTYYLLLPTTYYLLLLTTYMQTLIPESVTAVAAPQGRRGRLFGFALTPRALYLLLAGVVLAVPAFFVPHTLWMMPAWDVVILMLAVTDALRLPAPSVISVERRFEHAPALGEAAPVTLNVLQLSPRRLRIGLTDASHPALDLTPQTRFVDCYPHDPAALQVATRPALRGDLLLGKIFLRYRSGIGLAERWAAASVAQTVRVLPSAIGSEDRSIFLLRARQVELDRRRVRRIGIGREFEALRDYQAGDELRNLSWTATARRGKPITRVFTTERSQQVWTVIDAGRLSRTSFELRLPAPPTGSGPSSNGGRSLLAEVPGSAGFTDLANDHRLHLQQVDQAASAAMLLSQVVDRAGDRSALLAYGRGIQQQIAPGKGALHLRRILDALAMVHSETAEADHRRASARLRQVQGRRSLVFWITEMAESATTPEVALAVADLARQHLVVLLLLQHPELDDFAKSRPKDPEQMFAVTAANEMLTRRRTLIAQLERRGVLVVETSPAKVGVAAINQYLEIKSRGML